MSTRKEGDEKEKEIEEEIEGGKHEVHRKRTSYPSCSAPCTRSASQSPQRKRASVTREAAVVTVGGR